jgi:hypothetical protein
VLEPSYPDLRRGDVASTQSARTRVETAARWTSLACFAMLLFVGLRRHDMWFDELQAWNVARSSHDLGDLIGQLRYEGHPILWYLPLFAITRFTGDPRAMQALQFVIALSSIAIVLFRAPFRVVVCIAICASYFLSFEYAVISRSYGLSVLLCLVALSFLVRAEPRWTLGTVALVLMAFTSLAAAILAGSIAVAVMVGPRRALSSGDLQQRGPARRAGAWVLASCAVVVVACIPPSDFWSAGPAFQSSSPYIGGVAGRVTETLAAPWRGLVPLPREQLWNTNVLDGSSSKLVLAAVAGLTIVISLVSAFRSSPRALHLLGLGLAGYAAFFLLIVRPTEVRYVGQFAILLLATAWFAAGDSANWFQKVGVAGRVVLVGLLVVQVVAGAFGVSRSSTVFAQNELLADAARRHGVASHIVSGVDFLGIGVAGYLDRDIFSVAQGRWRRTLRFDEVQKRGEAMITPTALLCAAHALAASSDHDVGVISTESLRSGSVVARRGAARLYVLTPAEAVRGC